MKKKIVKKTKIKLFNLLLILIVFTGLFFACKYVFAQPTRNILIKGTTYLEDDYIIDIARVKDYPIFITYNGRSACKRLKKSNYISDCKIKKKIGYVLEINLVENKPLFYNMNNDKYIFNDGEEVGKEEISKNFRTPRLLNYVPDKKYKRFIKEMDKIEQDILSKISDIEYQPNEYDKDRFLLYMDDGNMVYLTLTKFKTINKYNNVLSQLENHKGILYLDSGNHFKIME